MDISRVIAFVTLVLGVIIFFISFLCEDRCRLILIIISILLISMSIICISSPKRIIYNTNTKKIEIRDILLESREIINDMFG